MPQSLPVRGLGPVILLALAAAGCSGGQSLRCNPDSMYLEAGTAGALRIPDDLSAPDETESLRIPGPLPPIDGSGQDPDRCLEASPGLVRND